MPEKIWNSFCFEAFFQGPNFPSECVLVLDSASMGGNQSKPEVPIVRIRWWQEPMLSGGLASHSALQFLYPDGSYFIFEKDGEEPFVHRYTCSERELHPHADLWAETGSEGFSDGWAYDILKKIEEFGKNKGHYDREWDLNWFNCHDYAKDVYNQCVTWPNQKWRKPDQMKTLAMRVTPGSQTLLCGAVLSSRALRT